MQLSEIDAMIRAENDPEKRSILQVLQCLTFNLETTTRVLKEMEDKMHGKISEQSEQLEIQQKELAKYHDMTIQAKFGWKVLSSVLGVLQGAILLIGAYGANLITELRVKVDSQAIVLPQLQIKLAQSDEKLHKLIEAAESVRR